MLFCMAFSIPPPPSSYLHVLTLARCAQQYPLKMSWNRTINHIDHNHMQDFFRFGSLYLSFFFHCLSIFRIFFSIRCHLVIEGIEGRTAVDSARFELFYYCAFYWTHQGHRRGFHSFSHIFLLFSCPDKYLFCLPLRTIGFLLYTSFKCD